MDKIYETFKFFKNNYVDFNIATEIYFVGDSLNNKIEFIFSRDSEFYILSGSIDINSFSDNEFFKWILSLDSCKAKMKITDFIKLGKVLKKNAISLTSDNTKFEFKFTDKETENEETITIYNEANKEYDSILERFNNIIKIIESSKIQCLEIKEKPDGETLEVYYQDGTFSFNRLDGTRVIEIPFTKVRSILKKSKLYLSFSNEDEYGRRFVNIYSQTDENIKLNQVFATI